MQIFPESFLLTLCQWYLAGSSTIHRSMRSHSGFIIAPAYLAMAMGSSVLHRLPYRRLCRLLREWRNASGLTQRAMGKRLRRPASYVHKCEVGERRIDPLEFIEWCRACGKSPPAALRAIESLTKR